MYKACRDFVREAECLGKNGGKGLEGLGREEEKH